MNDHSVVFDLLKDCIFGQSTDTRQDNARLIAGNSLKTHLLDQNVCLARHVGASATGAALSLN